MAPPGVPVRILSIIIFLVSAGSRIDASEVFPFPFILDVARDVPLVTAGCAAAGVSVYLNTVKPVPGRWETMTLKKSGLNPLDRAAVGNNLAASRTASDVLAITAAVAPLGICVSYLAKKENMNALTVFTMYAEAMIINIGVNGLIKGLVDRKRPFLYQPYIFHRKPRNRDSAMSFYSQHTSVAFCSMTFLIKVLFDTGDSWYNHVFLAAGLSVSGITAYLRFAAGLHFPTDLIAGAAIGSLIGYIVPLIHTFRSGNISLSLQAGEFNALTVRMRF